MMQIKEITSPRYTESGAIDCDVLFEGMEDPLPYTATPDDTAKTASKSGRSCKAANGAKSPRSLLRLKCWKQQRTLKNEKLRHGAQNRKRSRSCSNGMAAHGTLAPTHWPAFIR